MTIKQTRNGDELLLELGGRLDTSTAPELHKVVTESTADVNKLVIDLADIGYVSSAGLRVLLVAHKTMSQKGGMVVRHVVQDVMDVFAMTGFTEILDIED